VTEKERDPDQPERPVPQPADEAIARALEQKQAEIAESQAEDPPSQNSPVGASQGAGMGNSATDQPDPSRERFRELNQQ
jgi:hypothetical protein